jgi:AmmeMemoRadiSam system protein B
MQYLEKPRVRPYLVADQVRGEPASFEISDLLRLSPAVMRVSAVDLEIVKRLDGTQSIPELSASLQPLLGGGTIAPDYFTQLLGMLEECLFLDAPNWQAAIDNPVRPPSCIGCYDADPKNLTEQIESYYLHQDGPGIPRARATDHRIDAVLAPHIDYARGGWNFAHAFRQVYENTTARLFVIVATSHYSPKRFTLTRKSFRTPLGDVAVDGAFCDRLEQAYGPGLYDDELRAHFPEHSVELEVVFLQHLLGPDRPFRIVPLVVGAMDDMLQEPNSTSVPDDVARMVQALRQAREAAGEPVCFIISGDLAHIGPKFGDKAGLPDAFLAHSRDQDMQLMAAAANGSAQGYRQILAGEKDARRICGFPPTWLTLQVLGPCAGKLLRYDQHVHPKGRESVSFASMVFQARGG